MQRTRKVLDPLFWFAAVGVGLGLRVAPLRAQPSVTKETVIQAWKERQDRVKSARIEWTDRETVPRGYLSTFYTSAGFGPKDLEEMGIRPGSVVPPRDMTHDVASSVCLDGDKVRLEREDRQWSAEENAYLIFPLVSVSDGKLGKTLHTKGGPQTPWPGAHIQPGVTGYMDGPYMTPVALAYRPFIRRMSPTDPNALALTGRRAVVNGKSCLELERHFPRSEVVQRLWVDSSMNYAPVRLIFLSQDRVNSKIDIHYRLNRDGECLLEKWESMWFDHNGKLERANRVRVTKCEVNTAVQATEFDVAFPPGTVVSDATKGPRYQYIVKEGGRKRMIQGDELGASYEQLMNTSSGGASGNRESPLLSWPAILAAAVGLLAGALLVWRRMTARKHPA